MRSTFLVGLAMTAFATGASAQEDAHVRALSAGFDEARFARDVLAALE